MADCFSGRSRAVENLKQKEVWQLAQALDYFNLPKSMWPAGLLVRHVQGRQLDSLASNFMATIKADFVELAEREQEDDRACWRCTIISREYQLFNDKPPAGIHLRSGGYDRKGISFDQPLRDRLTALAAREFLKVSFANHHLRGSSQHIDVSVGVLW